MRLSGLEWSEDAEGTFFLLAVASADVHPPFWAGFPISGSHFVIDGGDASRSKRVHVTQRTLVMALSFGDLLLSQGRKSCGGKEEAGGEKSLHRD